MTGCNIENVSSEHLRQLRDLYRTTLFDDVVPWWQSHCLDHECGGFYCCLDREGRVWATDKYLWMIGRGVWMFSHLYNRYEKNPAWLEAARLGADFMLRHAFLPDGKMFFRLARDGRPMSKVLSLYTELFAAIALAELSVAAGDDHLWVRAMAMYDSLLLRFGKSSDTALLGYPINAEFHLHAHDMCRITLSWVFNELHPAQRFEDDLALSAESIVKKHWKPELQALLENVAPDGSPMLDLQEGRMFHPGHAIESAWMLMEIAKKQGNQELIATSVDIVLASLKQGWDQRYGGLRYLTNLDMSPTHELGANLKLWWPHCETLYALLLGWSSTGRDDLWQWYEKVHDYTFAHFSDPEYGEWYGYLDRNGEPAWDVKATGWKGFFHLPRGLFRCYQLLDRMLCTPKGNEYE